MNETDAQSSQPIRFDELHASAQAILQRYWQTDIAIAQAELLTEAERRNRVWRLHLEMPTQAEPVTRKAIVKQVAPINYAPADGNSFDTQRFFGDWAGAAFLSQLGTRQHGPQFYGGDRAAGFIILEDMGEHRSLVQPLLDENAASAAQALRVYTQRLAEMHADAYGREAEFNAICRTLHPHMPEMRNDGEPDLQAKIQQRLEEINAKLNALNVSMRDAALEEARAAFTATYRPTRFRTFIHSDPCPDNVFYNGHTLRLIDFEFARFGHALRDGLYARIPFPTCWCSKRVPDELVIELEQQYRQRFGTACPDILDDDIYHAEVATVAGHWAVDYLANIDAYIAEDWIWGIVGQRARVLTRLQTFIAADAKAERWPNLRAACADILARLQTMWPTEAAQPVYPAFLS